MTRPILLHAAAAREAMQARAYYAEVDPQLGTAFVDELEHTLHLAQRFPESGRPWRGDPGRRVFVLARFPYLVVLRLGVDRLRVLAVSHQHRRPGYWSERR